MLASINTFGRQSDLRQLGGKPPCAEISWVLVSFPVQKPRGQEEEYDSAASTEYN